MMKFALLCFALVFPTILAKNFGAINVEGHGNVYVVGPDWAGSFVQINNGNELRLNGGGRIYFAQEPNDGFSQNMFWKVIL